MLDGVNLLANHVCVVFVLENQERWVFHIFIGMNNQGDFISLSISLSLLYDR